MLGLEPTKGLDIVLDEQQGMVAVQTDADCKKTQFTDSLMPVNLFFEMFQSLTDYKGKSEEDLHVFKVKQFDDSNEISPNFFFLFDQKNIFRKARFTQKDIGNYDFEAVMPFNGKTFIKEDWYMNEDNCR